jgi:hypothetical protein
MIVQFVIGYRAWIAQDEPKFQITKECITTRLGILYVGLSLVENCAAMRIGFMNTKIHGAFCI